MIVADSTHIKACTAKGKVEKIVMEKAPFQYLNTLELEDSGLLSQPGKPSGPHYLAHTSINANNGIIIDVHPIAGKHK